MTTSTEVTRYAIKLFSVTQPATLGQWWHCQGLPKETSFAFAILYPTPEHAAKAMKTWRWKVAIERGDIDFEIVPVKCIVPGGA